MILVPTADTVYDTLVRQLGGPGEDVVRSAFAALFKYAKRENITPGDVGKLMREIGDQMVTDDHLWKTGTLEGKSYN